MEHEDWEEDGDCWLIASAMMEKHLSKEKEEDMANEDDIWAKEDDIFVKEDDLKEDDRKTESPSDHLGTGQGKETGSQRKHNQDDPDPSQRMPGVIHPTVEQGAKEPLVPDTGVSLTNLCKDGQTIPEEGWSTTHHTSLGGTNGKDRTNTFETKTCSNFAQFFSFQSSSSAAGHFYFRICSDLMILVAPTLANF